MEFSDQCKVIVQSMNRGEAMAFIKFLHSEIARHKMDIQEANKLILHVKDEFAILDTELGLDALDLNEAWHERV